MTKYEIVDKEGFVTVVYADSEMEAYKKVREQ